MKFLTRLVQYVIKASPTPEGTTTQKVLTKQLDRIAQVQPSRLQQWLRRLVIGLPSDGTTEVAECIQQLYSFLEQLTKEEWCVTIVAFGLLPLLYWVWFCGIMCDLADDETTVTVFDDTVISNARQTAGHVCVISPAFELCMCLFPCVYFRGMRGQAVVIGSLCVV